MALRAAGRSWRSCSSIPSSTSAPGSRSPDPVDFRFHQLVNVYDDANAYFNQSEWVNVPRPSSRSVPGDTRWTTEEENHFELALGTKGRSGLGQWDIWQAVFGPQGPDGYPAPIWDKATGEIDHTVSEAWKPMDLRLYLQENWATIGPQVAGRIHVYAGDDDNYFLNNAVELLDQYLQTTTNPAADAEFIYGHNQGHSWWPYTMPEASDDHLRGDASVRRHRHHTRVRRAGSWLWEPARRMSRAWPTRWRVARRDAECGAECGATCDAYRVTPHMALPR